MVGIIAWVVNVQEVKYLYFCFLFCQHVGLNKPPENHLYEIGLVDQYSIDKNDAAL